MKNFTFFRVIGCGLFGMLFLSPQRSGEKAPLITGSLFSDRTMLAAAGLLSSSYGYAGGASAPRMRDLFQIKARQNSIAIADSPNTISLSKDVERKQADQPSQQQQERSKTQNISIRSRPEPTFTSFKNTWAPIITRASETGDDEFAEERLRNRIEEVYRYAKDRNYSTRYAFLINLAMKSGRKRFFVIDLPNRSVHMAGLVAHGRGKERFTLDRNYSNRPGSRCSSLGFYRVGSAYEGAYGYSFKLIGLEKSNSNAYHRAIVLHSMGCIPDVEIDYPLCQSEGCPSVSPYFLGQLNTIIKESDRPVLMWVFDDSGA